MLEQTSLEELLATVEIRKEAYAQVTGEAEVVSGGCVLIEAGKVVAQERSAQQQRELMSIPRRPPWQEGMTLEELAMQEAEGFSHWRRELASTMQEAGFLVTPYERNLDFWRQLWRCVERSHLLVQIVDARDPNFYYCQDLARYIKEVDSSKRMVILVNKSDFLTVEQRRRWAAYFAAKGIDAIFFSALLELQRQQKRDATDQENFGSAVTLGGRAREGPVTEQKGAAADRPVDVLAADSANEDSDVEAPTTVLGPSHDDHGLDLAGAMKILEELRARLPEAGCTVGFVGYPNVGKSTVINALVGAKKVGMSRTPGKTKHIQTLELPEHGMTLCDCPGLVFPSVVASRAHLVINNTVPLEDLRECFSPIALIVNKIGFEQILKKYGCAAFVKDAAIRSGATAAAGSHTLDEAHTFLAALAVSRQHFLRVGVPDENWAARKVLRNYCRGELLYCEPPPGDVASESLAHAAASVDTAGLALDKLILVDADNDDDDFGDLDAALQGGDGHGGRAERHMTKRKVRMLNKQHMKGKSVGELDSICPGAFVKGKVLM